MYIESIVDAKTFDRIKKIENDHSCGFEVDWVENTPEGLEKHGIDGGFLGPDSEIPGVSLCYVRLWVDAPFSLEFLDFLENILEL
jgi:hypothetical protein